MLDIAYEEGGPAAGPPVLLLHGWPAAPRGWNAVAQGLQAAGWRTILPYLRGTVPTQFLDPNSLRVGSCVALAQDAIDLLDALFKAVPILAIALKSRQDSTSTSLLAISGWC